MVTTNEQERLQALLSYQILDSEAEKQYDAIANLATYICGTSMAAIDLIDDHRLWIKAKVNIDTCEFPRKDSFCNYTILTNHLLEVNDTTLDDRFKDNLYVTESPFIRYYAGVPLINADGYALGSICVFDTKPKQLDEKQKQALKFLADEVILHLEAGKKNNQLQFLLEEQQKFQSLFDNSSELHCIAGETGIIEFINSHVQQLLGYSPREVTGRTIWNFCAQDEKKAAIKLIKQATLKGEKKLEILTKMVTKSGEKRWFSWFNIHNNGRWLCNGRDVTKQIIVEQELKELSLVASQVNNGVAINNANNEILWVNKAFEKITGFNLQEVQGRKLRDLVTGKDTDKKVLDYGIAQSGNKNSFSIELLAYHKDQRAIWLSIMNSAILNDQGEISKSIEIITDITEQKKVDMEMQTLSLTLKKSDAGLLIRDDKGLVVWMNESMESIFGYTLEELKGSIIGKRFLGEESDLQEFQKAITASKEKKTYHIEIALYRKNGTRVWLSIYNNFLFDHNGNVLRQLSIATDITLRKTAEQELIRTREEALQLSRAKETFISVLSHEIRTPINAIITMSRFLLDEKPAAHQMENLGILNFSSENLLRLINDVLDFTKIETGNMILESVPVNLTELAKRTLNTLAFKLEDRKLQLLLNIDRNIPEFVLADSTRLYQILINLLANAVKFTSDGEVKLSLSIEKQDQKSVGIKFCVSDTGIGIAPDKLISIFEPYTQADVDTTRKYGGTGLGLTITKKLIELYQSTIQVKSELGFGSEFSFLINFKRAASEQSIIDLNQQLENLPAAVLVVDDNTINRTLAKKILAKWGIQTDLAENGLEAYKMIIQKDYDLVLMDLHMPVMDGLETTKRIRLLTEEKFQILPIIALTGSSFDTNMDGLYQNGLTDFFLKPYTPAGLYNKIKPYLKQPAVAQQ